MVYPKQAVPPGAVDSLKDKVLALHDYEGTCGLCLEPCDSTQDELNALSCTFEPCPSPSIYHQSCLEAYLKSIRLDKQRKTGFACPRNCGKAAKGEKACPGRVSKSHPIYARNDNSKKRRKAKMPDQLVVPPPAAGGKKPPLPKASPKGADDKSTGEERGKVVALVRGERSSKPVPIVVVNSAKQQAAAAHEDARAEVLLIRARSAATKDGTPRAEDKGPHPKAEEDADTDDEYAPPRGPASLADFAVSIGKGKGRKAPSTSGLVPDAKKGKEETPTVAPLEGPSRVSEAAPGSPADGPLQASPDGPSEAPPSPRVQESPRKGLTDGPRQEEAAKTLRSPSKSQRKHQQRLAARHLREKQDAGLRPKEGPLQAGDTAVGGGAGGSSLALQQPLETVQETAAFPPLPSSKPVVPPQPAPALPALRLTPASARADSAPEAPVAALPAPELSPRQAGGQAGLGQWSPACEAALRERKIQVHAAQLQGLGYFSEAQCVAAVRACGADLSLCCDWLLSGGAKGPTTPPQLDISAELARLSDLAAAGPTTQATLEAAVLRCQGDIDAALRPAPGPAGALPAPPLSIATTPPLAVAAPPVVAVSPGGGSEFGAISRPSSSSSNRSAGSPWGGLDSRGSSSEASSFFSTSAWGSLGASLVPSPPSQPDAGPPFSPFGGGFPSELLRTSSLRAEAAPPRASPAWPIPEGGLDASGADSFCSRDGSFLSRGGDPFGSFGVRSGSSVEAWSLSDLSDPDSADSALSEAHQSTVTSVAAAVLQDSFDDPVPPAPPAPAFAAPLAPPALWAGHYQDGPHMPQRMAQLGSGGHPLAGGKHGNPGARTGPHFKGYGPSEPPAALWGFNGVPPPQPHSGFGEPVFFEGAGRAPGMAAGYGRQGAPGGPLGEGGQFGANGRQLRGMPWRDVGPGRGFGPEGPHHWADQDRLVTQLLSQLLV